MPRSTYRTGFKNKKIGGVSPMSIDKSPMAIDNSPMSIDKSPMSIDKPFSWSPMLIDQHESRSGSRLKVSSGKEPFISELPYDLQAEVIKRSDLFLPTKNPVRITIRAVFPILWKVWHISMNNLSEYHVPLFHTTEERNDTVRKAVITECNLFNKNIINPSSVITVIKGLLNEIPPSSSPSSSPNRSPPVTYLKRLSQNLTTETLLSHVYHTMRTTPNVFHNYPTIKELKNTYSFDRQVNLEMINRLNQMLYDIFTRISTPNDVNPYDNNHSISINTLTTSSRGNVEYRSILNIQCKVHPYSFLLSTQLVRSEYKGNPMVISSDASFKVFDLLTPPTRNGRRHELFSCTIDKDDLNQGAKTMMTKLTNRILSNQKTFMVDYNFSSSAEEE